MPMTIFACCYLRIFHTIRHQSKVVSGHAGRSEDIPMATTSRDPNAEQIQQQATGATTGAKLSRTEMNVLKTMIAVIICFIIFLTPGSIINVVRLVRTGLINVSYFCATSFAYIITWAYIQRR